MTLASEQSQQVYVGDDLASTFSIPFRVLDKSHLTITETDTSGAVTVLIEGTHFLFANLTAYIGWQIDLIKQVPYGDPRPLPSGYVLKISRTPPFIQNLNLRNQGTFQAETIEDKFDYLTMLAQRVRDLTDMASFSSLFQGALVGDRDGVNKVFTLTDNGVPLISAPRQVTVWCNYPLPPETGYTLGPADNQVTLTAAPISTDALFAQGVN